MKQGTFYATTTMRGLMARAEPAELEQMHAAIHFYLLQFGGFKRKGQSAAAVPAVHGIIDRELLRTFAQPNAPTITCRKHCAHCCHIPVQATELEARRMVGAARAAGHTIDRDRLKRQAQADDFNALPRADRACVMLTSVNTCAAYEARPVACRKYHVATDPKLCDMDTYPGGDVGIAHSPHAECIASAFGTVFGAAPLPSLLADLLGVK